MQEVRRTGEPTSGFGGKRMPLEQNQRSVCEFTSSDLRPIAQYLEQTYERKNNTFVWSL